MLFDSIVYGPIHSRRLGSSLGINLMPTNDKLCSFNCIYCECGYNTPANNPQLPSREEVKRALEAKLQQLKETGTNLDVITFSGNGEPTLHPDFEGIIKDTCELRDRYCKDAKVSVLSNSTQLMREDVVNGLRRCDNRILKLDSAIDATMRKIDQPVNSNLTVDKIVEMLGIWEGDFTLQTCFLDGINTSDEEVNAWLKAVEQLHPKQVMIYVIDRPTPDKTLRKVSPEKMNEIGQMLRDKGFDVIVCC